MGRKGNQKQNRGSWKSQNPNAQKAFLTDDHYESPSLSRYSPDSLRSLRKELKDAIAEIYFKYFSQFQCRKESRVLSQDPTYSVSKEELNIEKNYCNELTQKVKQLVHLDSLEDIYFTFCKILNSFMGFINYFISQKIHI